MSMLCVSHCTAAPSTCVCRVSLLTHSVVAQMVDVCLSTCKVLHVQIVGNFFPVNTYKYRASLACCVCYSTSTCM